MIGKEEEKKKYLSREFVEFVFRWILNREILYFEGENESSNRFEIVTMI